MTPLTDSPFALSDAASRPSTSTHHPTPKADPRLIAGDERRLAAIAAGLEHQVAELTERLATLRRSPGGSGQDALDRDLAIHRLTARLRTLTRYGLDLCLGRMVPAGGDAESGGAGDPVHVGRLGLSDADGERLLVDWRSPAAAPFFGATHADPMGLASRRRYRWSGGRISDYWDEVFTAEGLADGVALDDESAFIAGLGASRSDRMRDVLATIAADQDAVVRAGSRGALVVDGGPGTGKTVVALHRAAYLLYSDPRLKEGRGRVLFIGPHRPYLAYVADVLPDLGEDGVQTCTLRDLLPEGATAPEEPDPRVAALKADAAMVDAIEPAVGLYEEPPTTGLTLQTPWDEVTLSAADWARAFDAADPGVPHDENRDVIWEELLTILAEHLAAEAPADLVRRSLRQDRALADALNAAWPVLDPGDLVGDLFTVSAYLRRCAPWLDAEQVALLQRRDPGAWTASDLPLLDAARRRVGDPAATARRRRRERAESAERERMSQVVDGMIQDGAADGLASMLVHEDLRAALVDAAALPEPDPDLLAGPFAHVVVDEAQELTDAEWQMVLARCPSRSLTIVGDRAQARRGFPEAWRERLTRVGVRTVTEATLRVNYRTPEEVMTEAEPVIRAALPDANVPTSIRSSGVPVGHGRVTDLPRVLTDWLAAHEDGVACVIGAPDEPALPDGVDPSRVRALTPAFAKGLEFDLVVLVDPAAWGDDVAGAVDRYVAMTRATQELHVLT